MLTLRSLYPLLLASFVLFGCQSPEPDYHPEAGARREVIAVSYGKEPSREVIIQAVTDSAKQCWLGKLPGFANLTMGPVERSPDGGMLVRFVDKKNPDRKASFHVVPTSGTSGYLAYVQQKGDGVDIVKPVDQAVHAVAIRTFWFQQSPPC